jgi:hypothetical protein
MTPETPDEELLHAIYDALKWLDLEASEHDDNEYAQPARAILRGQLEKHEYPPDTENLGDAIKNHRRDTW